MSLAFEESFLFSNSARENISLGLDNATQEEVEKAALTARAHEFISLLPESVSYTHLTLPTIYSV